MESAQLKKLKVHLEDTIIDYTLTPRFTKYTVWGEICRTMACIEESDPVHIKDVYLALSEIYENYKDRCDYSVRKICITVSDPYGNSQQKLYGDLLGMATKFLTVTEEVQLNNGLRLPRQSAAAW